MEFVIFSKYAFGISKIWEWETRVDGWGEEVKGFILRLGWEGRVTRNCGGLQCIGFQSRDLNTKWRHGIEYSESTVYIDYKLYRVLMFLLLTYTTTQGCILYVLNCDLYLK